MQPGHHSEETSSKPRCNQSEGGQFLTCPQRSLQVGEMMVGQDLPCLLPLTLGDTGNSWLNVLFTETLHRILGFQKSLMYVNP